MEYEEVSARFRTLASESGKGARPEEIQQAERELGVVLPASYRAFLREFGWGSVAHWEVHGLGADVPPHMNFVRITLDERQEALPPALVPVLNDGGGGLHCLDTSLLADGECPVVFWDHEQGEAQVPNPEAESFSTWLSERRDLSDQFG